MKFSRPIKFKLVDKLTGGWQSDVVNDVKYNAYIHMNILERKLCYEVHSLLGISTILNLKSLDMGKLSN